MWTALDEAGCCRFYSLRLCLTLERFTHLVQSHVGDGFLGAGPVRKHATRAPLPQLGRLF